ncbi:hypothetical protein HQ585_08510 [candidate division KSB1 bacterium]|nr:hypothetical protein [candidate division KSB1 bacterium]
MQSKQNQKLFYIIFGTFIGLHVLMIWMIRLFPFIDLPMHLACAQIFRDYNQPDNAFHQFFVLRNILFQPNIAHLLFCSFKGFPSVEFANKLFYSLYVILLPISVFFLIRKLKGNIWFALLSMIYLYNYSVTWGFTDYALGIPLFLFYLIKQYDYITNPNWKDGVLLSLFLIILFHVHGLITFFAIALLAFQIILFNIKNLKRMALSGLILLPILLIVGFWLSIRATSSGDGGHMLSRLIHYYLTDFLPSLPRRLGIIYWDHSFLASGQTGHWIGLGFSAFILMIVSSFLIRPAISIKNRMNEPEFRFVLSFLLFSLIVYFFISSIRGMLLLSYYRFSVLVFISLIVIGSLFSAQQKMKWRPIFIVTAVLIHFGLWMDYFTDFQKVNQDFTPDLLPKNTQEKVLAGLMYDSLFRGQPVYMHVPNYFMVWRKGIATNRFVEFPTPWAVGRKVGPDLLPYYQEWLWLFKNYQGQYTDVEYLLIRGRVPQKDLDYFKSFNMITMQNEWLVLQNTHPGSSDRKEE